MKTYYKRIISQLIILSMIFTQTAVLAVPVVQLDDSNYAAYIKGNVSQVGTSTILGNVFSAEGNINLSTTDESNIIDGTLTHKNGVTITHWTPNQITGGKLGVDNLSFNATMPEFPETPIVQNNGGSLVCGWYPLVTIFQSTRFDSLTITGTTTIDTGNKDMIMVVNELVFNGGNIVLAGTGNLYLFVEESVRVSNSFKFNENGDSDRLHIFVKNGNFSANNYTTINGNLYIENGNASFPSSGSRIKGNLVVSGTAVNLANDMQVMGIVFAPNARVDMQGGSLVRGYVVGDSLYMTGSSDIIYAEGSLIVPNFAPTSTPSVIPTSTPSVIPTSTPSVIPTQTPTVIIINNLGLTAMPADDPTIERRWRVSNLNNTVPVEFTWELYGTGIKSSEPITVPAGSYYFFTTSLNPNGTNPTCIITWYNENEVKKTATKAGNSTVQPTPTVEPTVAPTPTASDIPDCGGTINFGNPSNPSFSAEEYYIYNYAGTGIGGFNGDNGSSAPRTYSPATSGEVYGPRGLSVDKNGNLYIADERNGSVRKVTTTNSMSTITGNGIENGFTPSEYTGSAYGKAMYEPMDIIVGPCGDDIFFLDTDHHIVRMIDSNGNLRTVAGVLEIGSAGGYSNGGGVALNAKFNAPQGIAIDTNGNMYIADTNNHIVRKITRDGNITNIAGQPGIGGFSGDGSNATSAMLNRPVGLAFDSNGDLYVADMDNHRIRKIDLSTGKITTVAGSANLPRNSATAEGIGDDGDATNAMLFFPNDIAIDAADNLYIADTQNHKIRKVFADSGIITTIAGDGYKGFSGNGVLATTARLSAPKGIAVDADGNVYISDTENNIIRRLEP